MEFSLQHSAEYSPGKSVLVFDPYVVPLFKPDVLDYVDKARMQQCGIADKEAIGL